MRELSKKGKERIVWLASNKSKVKDKERGIKKEKGKQMVGDENECKKERGEPLKEKEKTHSQFENKKSEKKDIKRKT